MTRIEVKDVITTPADRLRADIAFTEAELTKARKGLAVEAARAAPLEKAAQQARDQVSVLHGDGLALEREFRTVPLTNSGPVVPPSLQRRLARHAPQYQEALGAWERASTVLAEAVGRTTKRQRAVSAMEAQLQRLQRELEAEVVLAPGERAIRDARLLLDGRAVR